MSVRVVYCGLLGARRGFARGGRFAEGLVSGEISAGGGCFWHCGDVFPFLSFFFVLREVKEGRRWLWVEDLYSGKWTLLAGWERTLKALKVSQRARCTRVQCSK